MKTTMERIWIDSAVAKQNIATIGVYNEDSV